MWDMKREVMHMCACVEGGHVCMCGGRACVHVCREGMCACVQGGHVHVCGGQKQKQ